MSYNGSGTYSLPAGNPVTANSTISSTVHNNTMSDIASALSNAICKDGQTTVTADLPMATYKFTGLGAGSAAGHSIRYEQVFTTGTVSLLGALTVPGAVTPQALLDISGGSAGQVKFPATQNASSDANTLDDYEEGSYTPTLTFATPGDLSASYSVQAAHYTKIGNLCIVSVDLDTSAFTHTTASGLLYVNLPFTSSSASNSSHSGAGVFSGITKAGYTSFCARVLSNASIAQIGASGSGVAASNVTAADMPTGGTVQLRFTLIYRTA